jgi:hypothetical protein
MKITIVFISLLLAFCSNAQDITLKFEIKMQGLAQEMAAFADMQGINYFKNEKCRIELENMMFSMRSYIHSDGVTVCQNVMDEKKYYKRKKQDFEAERPKSTDIPKITYTEESKMILGYECKKVLVQTLAKDKSEIQTELWVTKALKLPETYYMMSSRNSAAFNGIDGTVLYMETPIKMQGNNAVSIMRVTEITTTPLKDSLFEPETAGYTESTYEEIKSQMRSMGGGMR